MFKKTYIIAVLIAEDAAALLAVELVAGVVDASLDALVERDAVRGDLVPVLLVQLEYAESTHG